MTSYEVSRSDTGVVARLEWDDQVERGAITYLKWNPPYTYQLKSRKLYDAVRENLLTRQRATLTEVTT